ncbi:hypothetical protein LTR16_012319, partial [Cryomyces antarcticus]
TRGLRRSRHDRRQLSNHPRERRQPPPQDDRARVLCLRRDAVRDRRSQKRETRGL